MTKIYTDEDGFEWPRLRISDYAAVIENVKVKKLAKYNNMLKSGLITKEQLDSLKLATISDDNIFSIVQDCGNMDVARAILTKSWARLTPSKSISELDEMLENMYPGTISNIAFGCVAPERRKEEPKVEETEKKTEITL